MRPVRVGQFLSFITKSAAQRYDSDAMAWQPLLPQIFVWRDSCNVYAVAGPDGTVIIDAGTGNWLDHLDELPKPPVALLCTHFFRDHSAGAVKAARVGLPVYVPEGEHDIFANPRQHFAQRDTFIIYDNYWDLCAPIEGIPVAGVLQDYGRITLGGLDFEVVPLPGVTLTQVGLALRVPYLVGDARSPGQTDSQIVFCAEAIHSPGRMARIAPLQYNYNDLGGAVNAWYTARDLRRLQPDALLPSLGQPICTATDDALEGLQMSLANLCAGRPVEAAHIAAAENPLIRQVSEHVWHSTQAASISWFIISKNNKALVIDYGYHEQRGLLAAGYSKPYRRRPLLHSLEALKTQFGIERIDVALISHFHDDHVCGVRLLQRLHGTQCWVTDAFSDLLSEPAAHAFPCNWPYGVHIDRCFRHDQIARWEEYEFQFAPMSGHTRFGSLIGFEADGLRFAHTGDQYFFLSKTGAWPAPDDDFRTWDDKTISQNHVYRNGALLDGYALSADWLTAWRPDIVLSGHQQAFHTNADFFRIVKDWAGEYAELHKRAMALGDDEAHFNLDSWGGWIWPYRSTLKVPGPATVKVTVRNPLPHKATLDVRLVGPTGWSGTSATLYASARAEVSCQLEITPDAPCILQPFAVELVADGQPFGQVAEGLMTVNETGVSATLTPRPAATQPEHQSH